MAFLEEFRYLKIPLEDVKLATNNFDKDKRIGRGGFGPVYKGEVSHSKGRGLVAFKRLNGELGQGAAEFSKEIVTLSRYTHENLISLLGFCDEGGEKILIYEYAVNGSLDRHLTCATTLNWRQRLKISLQSARALEYLHDPRGAHQRVLHCDIKTGNILLDDKWNAKLSDLGLSKMGPANQPHTFLISSGVGTIGYCDPLYLVQGFLTKESDVYSFGVLLFEVLCGKVCYKITNRQIQVLVPCWKESYEQNRLEEIVFEDLMKQEMDQAALKIFSDIAYRCLKTSHEERPTMTEVATELQLALEIQEISEGKEELIDYEEMARTAEPPLKYRCKAEIKILLSKGVFLNGGKTWFSINKNGKHCEMISIAACLETEYKRDEWTPRRNSKFAVGRYKNFNGFEAHVRPQFLTPFTTYAVNLVFQCDSVHTFQNKKFRCSLKGETESSIAYFLVEREDGRWMLELYQFDSHDQSMLDLEILVGKWGHQFLVMEVEGFEFQPLEMVEYKVPKDGKGEVQSIPDADANWEEKLPADYEDIIKRSKKSLQWTGKKELYSILRYGFLVNDGQEWFSLDKNGLKCQMLSARSVVSQVENFIHLSLPATRFGEGFQCFAKDFTIKSKIKTQALSSETTYAVYLVYKFPQDQSTLKAPLFETVDSPSSTTYNGRLVHLVSPQTPIINPEAGEKTTSTTMNIPSQSIDLPQGRSDGWMEVQIFELETGSSAEEIFFVLRFFVAVGVDKNVNGLIVQGIELRPMHI